MNEFPRKSRDQVHAAIREEKIASVKQEFHRFNDMEIQPGFNVNDLLTREECSRAVGLLGREIDAIVAQLNQARVDHSQGTRLIDGGWQIRAQNAIRYKRRVMQAVKTKMESIPRSKRREDFRKCMIEVIRQDLGDERLQRYAEETRRRFPDAARDEDDA